MKIIENTKRIAKHAGLAASGALAGIYAKTVNVLAAQTYSPNIGNVDPSIMGPLQKLLDVVYWAGIAIAGTAVMISLASFLFAGDDSVKRDRAKRQAVMSVIAVVGIASSFPLVNWILG